MKKGVFILSLQIFLFCFVLQAHAVTLYMDPNNAELKRGDTIVVAVRLDTDEGECVNVVDGTITYSENIQPVDTSRGSSIFSLWVEEPVIDKTNRTITFAGGIPNGYCGRIPGDPQLTNTVVELLFQSPGLQIGSTESGNVASINFAPETHVLLNDGFGTVQQPKLFGSTVTLAQDAGSTIQNPWQEIIDEDDVAPESFSISLERTNNAFSNKYFITFNTTDKQTGIDHYEVIEEPLEKNNLFSWGAATAPWVRAKSPYVLDDQSLNSTIRVKALDKAGNETIAVFVPDEAQRAKIAPTLLVALTLCGVLLVIAAIVIGMFLIGRKRKRETETDVSEHEIK